MTSLKPVLHGFIIMIICEVVAIALVVFGGQIIDTYYSHSLDAGMLTDYPSWSAAANYQLVNNIFYGVCFFIALFGILWFVGSVLKRQQYDSYLNDKYY